MNKYRISLKKHKERQNQEIFVYSGGDLRGGCYCFLYGVSELSLSDPESWFFI